MAQSHEHIFLQDIAKSERFTTTSSGGGKSNIPERDRISHSQYLISKFSDIRKLSVDEKQQREAMSLPTHRGTYLEFKSGLNADLITESLENIRQGIRLLSIRPVQSDNGQEVRAIVYIPQGKEATFIKKIQDYADDSKNTIKGNPKNAPLVNSIEDVQLALLESFWSQAERTLIPNQQPIWCEVWLRIDDSVDFDQQISTFSEVLKNLQIPSKGRALQFPERAVLLVLAERNQLTSLISSSDLLAEFRIGQEAASFWTNESNVGQIEWAEDLLNRLEIEESNIKVCILDSGVNNGHMLLLPILDDENCLTVNPMWGTDDRSEICPNGHGTLMAGLVGYGDLQKNLESTSSVILTHKLCSVKILPSIGSSEKEHWGDITEQAVYRAEVKNPEGVLLYCLAITSDLDVDKGRPSSWSGAIDIMSYGGSAKKQRLFIVSAGNVPREYWSDYPTSNRLFSVQNPAQSWNSLTVGAYTAKVLVEDTHYDSYERIAKINELSPYSSTSYLWNKKWPIKPEVLFEGGNLFKRDGDTVGSHTDLELLTTSKYSIYKQFDTITATSAATAQASCLAAKIKYLYPNAWPETIRALIVHSASWTDEMISQFDVNVNSKASVQELLRTCGFGVPNANRALNSFENGLTFVSQEIIQPYIKESGKFRTNEMHFFDLPWPRDLLISLSDTPVKLKITLSYFIEPGVGEIGWKDKYRYQSFGLRFEINNINETEDEFKKRINKQAREDDEDVPDTNSGSGRWLIGKHNRDVGSIHSDVWQGTASEMAECNKIAIYPIIGWWRERHNLKKYNAKTRYSLIVSLDTPTEDIELYSTVKALIQVPIEISLY